MIFFTVLIFSLFGQSLSFPQTVSSLNVTNYLGRWYQMYADLSVDITFENSSYCVTADYGNYPNGTISVLNRERQYSVNGPERMIYGWANTLNSSFPGELTVHLQTTGGFGAPYWVYELGPILNDSYQYSIVSDPFLLTLFVLARNVSEFNTLYNSQVLNTLTDLGFNNFIDKPIQTIQNGCTYW